MVPKSPAGRTYRTAAFAAFAGVTSRALRHYDRLGLLKPKRTAAGYRVYAEHDLETLEEIVALKFIGVPLKKIAAIRRQSRGSFAEVLRAQRQTLETKQRNLARAIAAVAAAETALQSGAMDVQLFRQIIEVMHMDTDHEETIASYVGMLKTKISHLSGISPEQRAALQQEWLRLVDDVQAAVHEDPGEPKAQGLLDRWLAFLQALTGTDPAKMMERRSEKAFRATPELRDELWARRAEWMPTHIERDTSVPADAEAALARAQQWSQYFANPEVLEFIKRARSARLTRDIQSDTKE
jgi:DNA-binding transcriptional MerR regulator